MGVWMDKPHVEFWSHTLETETLDGARRWPRADRQECDHPSGVAVPAQQNGAGGRRSVNNKLGLSFGVVCSGSRSANILVFDFGRPRPKQKKKKYLTCPD